MTSANASRLAITRNIIDLRRATRGDTRENFGVTSQGAGPDHGMGRRSRVAIDIHVAVGVASADPADMMRGDRVLMGFIFFESIPLTHAPTATH